MIINLLGLNCLRIKGLITKVFAIGSSSHAMGTVKAIKTGTSEGTMSNSFIAVAGILTVIEASVFSYFY